MVNTGSVNKLEHGGKKTAQHHDHLPQFWDFLVEIVKMKASNQRRYTGPCQLSESAEALSYDIQSCDAPVKMFAKNTICLLLQDI